MTNFSELSLSSVLNSNLSRNGFVEPTAVQQQAIPAILAGRDLIATAQTGTGKTLAFLLPIVEAILSKANQPGISALILTPTRELAMQIHEAFGKLASNTGIRAAVVVGGMNEGNQLRAIRAGAKVVIATPGRLCDFLDRRAIQLANVRMLVLDEADRMLDMGFLPSLKRILGDVPKERQTLFFSATIEESVRPLLKTHLKDPVRIAIGSTTKPAQNVDLDLYEVESDHKINLLRSIIRDQSGSVLVFARTKRATERLSKALSGSGMSATRIHGDRTQNQRNQALRGFQNREYDVLVATDVAARGIHVDGIAHVVNFDLPQVPEDFIHRVGRTGRAGSRGTASTFATRSERGNIRKIENALDIRMRRCESPAGVALLEGDVVERAIGQEPIGPRRHVRTAAPSSRFKPTRFGKRRSAGR